MKYITYAAIIGIAYYIIRRIEDYFYQFERRLIDIETKLRITPYKLYKEESDDEISG